MRITVFTNFRTSSSWFTKLLARTYKAKYMDEFFHHSPRSASNGPKAHRKNLERLKTQDRWCVKVMGLQLTTTPIENLDQELVDLSDQVFFYLRRDFKASVKSWYIGDVLASKGTDFHLHAEWDKPVEISYNEERFRFCEQQMINSLNAMHEVYKKHKTGYNLLWMEDIAKENSKPYKRPVVWKNTPPDFLLPHRDFDIVRLFE